MDAINAGLDFDSVGRNSHADHTPGFEEQRRREVGHIETEGA